MSSDILKPPVYCPNAIVTDAGWVNPKTGELLIAVRNLRQRIDEQALASQHNREDNKSETEKILDRLTEITLAQQKVDDRSDTQKALDKLTDQAVEPIIVDSMAELEAESVTITKENNNITIGIKESTEVEEAVNKPKRPGRPKKQKSTDEQQG